LNAMISVLLALATAFAVAGFALIIMYGIELTVFGEQNTALSRGSIVATFIALILVVAGMILVLVIYPWSECEPTIWKIRKEKTARNISNLNNINN